MSRFRQSRDGVERCNIHASARIDREVYDSLQRIRRATGVSSLKAVLEGFLADAIGRALERLHEEENQDEPGDEEA